MADDIDFNEIIAEGECLLNNFEEYSSKFAQAVTNYDVVVFELMTKGMFSKIAYMHMVKLIVTEHDRLMNDDTLLICHPNLPGAIYSVDKLINLTKDLLRKQGRII